MAYYTNVGVPASPTTYLAGFGTPSVGSGNKNQQNSGVLYQMPSARGVPSPIPGRPNFQPNLMGSGGFVNPNINSQYSGFRLPGEGPSYDRSIVGSILDPAAASGGAQKCPKGSKWDPRAKVCMKVKVVKPKPIRPPKGGGGGKGVSFGQMKNLVADQFGINPAGEQAHMLAQQEMGMWSSAAERDDFFNTHDPNGPYGISDGYNYGTDSWVNDPWTDTSDGFDNAWSAADSDNYSGWGSQEGFDNDFGSDSYWAEDSDAADDDVFSEMDDFNNDDDTDFGGGSFDSSSSGNSFDDDMSVSDF